MNTIESQLDPLLDRLAAEVGYKYVHLCRRQNYNGSKDWLAYSGGPEAYGPPAESPAAAVEALLKIRKIRAQARKTDLESKLAEAEAQLAALEAKR